MNDQIADPGLAGSLVLSQPVADTDIPESVWIKRYLESPGRLSKAYRWTTEVETLDYLLDLAPIAAQIDIFGYGSVVSEMEGALLYVRLMRDEFFVRVTGNTQASERALETLRTRFPEVQLPEHDIRFKFWMHTDAGPRATGKTMTCPKWEEIARNYPSKTGSELAHLMNGFRPDSSGLMVLWFGPPGTGKTWAIQALARQWQPWADFNVISDPERFFAEASYMHHVMLFGNRFDNERWSVLVLEDTGEMLSSDAKQRTGQGLSRLLNLTDGLMGRGSRTLVLITSNEDLQTFHPAVARAGRCAAKVGFDAFRAEESESWFERHDYQHEMARGTFTLAEMYAQLRGEASPQKSGFGFRPSIPD